VGRRRSILFPEAIWAAENCVSAGVEVSASVEAFNVEVLDVPIPERFVESDDTVVAEFQKDVYDGPSFLASEKVS
jgi:hypothetical protein